MTKLSKIEWLIIGLFTTSILALLYPITFSGLTSNEIGDYYGGTIGTIASVAATILLYVSLREQRDELKNQRDLNRRQEIYQTFYQLLSMRESMLNDMDLEGSKGQKITGRDCLKIIWKNVEDDVSPQRLLSTYSAEISAYFKFLAHIAVFVNSSFSEKADRSNCLELIKATLTEDETQLISYLKEKIGGLDVLVSDKQ